MGVQPFHLAIVVDDLSAAREFYGDTLGCREGRSSNTWVDFDLFGHQLVTHLHASGAGPSVTNPVDAHDVPVPHFGVVLSWEQFEEFSLRLQDAGVAFVIKPTVRFAGQVGEQSTMFFRDPSGNALEFLSLI
ncbi:MAG: VOC family protein, partial [Nannocystaceae bacterium]|nr:VOC family protein [Nannocystaceae bacterium]